MKQQQKKMPKSPQKTIVQCAARLKILGSKYLLVQKWILDTEHGWWFAGSQTTSQSYHTTMEHISEHQITNCGVPQGFILGSLLFITRFWAWMMICWIPIHFSVLSYYNGTHIRTSNHKLWSATGFHPRFTSIYYKVLIMNEYFSALSYNNWIISEP